MAGYNRGSVEVWSTGIGDAILKKSSEHQSSDFIINKTSNIP